MILVVTHSKDLSADLVIRHLHADGQKYVRLNTDHLVTPECFFGFRDEPELHIDNRVILGSDISSIWARRFALPRSLQDLNLQYAEFVKREHLVVMDAFLEGTTDAFQINPAHADQIAGNRLLQMRRARKFGFSIPDSLVTQDAEAARRFIATHAQTITKALSFGRVSSESGNELVAFASVIQHDVNMDGLSCCPSLLQDSIPKRCDWRVTTVGDRVFSAKATFDKSRSLDWRADKDAATRFSSAELPEEISDRLIALSRESKIVYGAHDLVESVTGEFFFLETNPAGQWGWLELTLDLPISRAIADELVAHSRG